MQAIILAAGKSTRTYPLTLTRPKPLLKVANKTLLEHNLDNLNGIVDEVIIIVGYKKEMIKKFLRNKYKNLRIKYVVQQKQLGTGNALLTVEKYIKNEFISLYGDDIYSKKDFKNIIKNKYSILAKKVENPQLFGVIVEKNKILINLIEKPKKFVSNLVNTGLYKLDKKIFSLIKKLKKSKRNEYELTDAIKDLSKVEKINCIISKYWIPVVYPLDLLKADRMLRKNKDIIGKKTKIHGKIQNSTIGNNCVIKGNVRNSIVMDKTIITKNSIVENSIIGEKVYFSGKASGAVIADNSKLVNVIIKAGCKIWPDKKIKNKNIEHDVQ